MQFQVGFGPSWKSRSPEMMAGTYCFTVVAFIQVCNCMCLSVHTQTMLHVGECEISLE